MPIIVKKTSLDSRGTENYRRGLRAAVRGLWLGALDRDQFWESMSLTINSGITSAWHAGAADCGIAPDELSPEELTALQKAIDYEHLWIGGFANTIMENTKAKGGKLTPLFSRAEIWIGRWEGTRSAARVMACKDKKLKWNQGPTEQGCPTCSRLNGQVRRASFWQAKGVLPRVHGSPLLDCQGYRCECTLDPTDEPSSRGRLPKLP